MMMDTRNEYIALNQENLNKLREDVVVPTYDRSQLTQSIVHMGVGGFHRAHQAVYLDDLQGLQDAANWGECGLGIMQADARMRDALKPQDCLYAVVERSAAGQTARVIGSMVDYLYAPDSLETAIERMASPDCKIVSLTITEGGYFINEASGEFDESHPFIQRDLLSPENPTSSVGMLAKALDRRRRRGLPPFTVMSCDNLQGNGDVIKRVLGAYAGLVNGDLHHWIRDHVAFPNSMVDRITPATTHADIATVSETFGFDDAWPVVTEPFRQWVIEDHFCQGRPQWDRVGAQLVDDVAPYEIMKMRLLNGSHLAMAYLGAIAGFTYVHEIMQDQLFDSFIKKFMEQVTPVVPKIPGTSIPEYKKTLISRFANPTINDQVTRICSEGSAKMPKWILPTIVELLDRGAPTQLLSLVIASWIFYFRRERDERGQPLQRIDAQASELTQAAEAGGANPRSFLKLRSIFGEDLPAHPLFVSQVENAMRLLAEHGAAGAIQSCLAS